MLDALHSVMRMLEALHAVAAQVEIESKLSSYDI
jgi:hypothetical protein